MLLLAPAASAEPPANDKFEDAQELAGSLPISVPGTNVDAEKEEGEPFIGFGAGHTVWYEWTAADTGFVTIGACERQIETALGVFTGNAVNALTKVVDGNAAEGPHCPFGQREYTFKAAAGTTYEIGVDGSGFSFPGGPKPVTEGEFTLRIEETPTPVNDDFANAQVFNSSLEEEFEGKAFYWGSVFGYNWNATEEIGEPDHVGGPHGASVWYSWTAPVRGEAEISAGFFSGIRMSVYRGSSLSALELMFGGMGPAGGASFMTQAGTTYKIAIYGLLDELSGEAEMSSFQFNISMRVPVAVDSALSGSTASSRSEDTTPPDTRINKRVSRRHPWVWAFDVRSAEPGVTFRCRIDRRRFEACGSRMTSRGLKVGLHSLEAVAVDNAGNVDPSPAMVQFRVHRLRHPRDRREPRRYLWLLR